MPATRRLILEEKGDDVVFEVLDRSVRIGREPGLELTFDDPQLSKRHCEIRLLDGLLVVRDLGSTNGTRVNGREVTFAELKAGDVVQIGEHVIHIDRRREASGPVTRASAASESPATPATPASPRPVQRLERSPLAVAGVVALLAVVGIAAFRTFGSSDPVVDPRLERGRARLAVVAEFARFDRVIEAETELAEIEVEFGDTALRAEIDRARGLLAAAFLPPPMRMPATPAASPSVPAGDVVTADGDSQFTALLTSRRFAEAQRFAERSPRREALEKTLEGALAAARTEIERDFAARQASDGDSAARAWLGDVLRTVPITSPTYAGLQTLLLRGAAVARGDAVPAPAGSAKPATSDAGAKPTAADVPPPPDAAAKKTAAEELLAAGDLAGACEQLALLQSSTRGRSRTFDAALDRFDRAVAAETAYRAALARCSAAGGTAEVAAGESASGTFVGADENGLKLAQSGSITPFAWRVVPAAIHVALVEKLPLTPAERIDAASVLYRLGKSEDAERVLARAAAKITPDLRTRIDRAVADGRDLPLPEGGFALVDGRLLSPAEVRRRELNLAVDAATKNLAAKDAAGRRAAFDAFLALGDDVRPSLHRALLDRRAALAAALEKDGAYKRLSALNDKRNSIDRMREELLKLIFDEGKYPYPYRPPEATAEQYASCIAQQKLINEQTLVLKKAWGDGDAVKVSPAFAELAAQIAECVAWSEESAAPDSPPEPAFATLLPSAAEVTVRNIAIDAADRALIDASEEIMTAHAAMKGFGSRGEMEQARITSEYRVMLGRRALIFYDPIARASRGHCEDMIAHGFFAHESRLPGKSSPSDRMRLQGVAPLGGGENIARASGAQGAFEGWRNSSGHHRNMLGAGWRYVGVGNSGNHWCQLFIVRDGNNPDHASK